MQRALGEPHVEVHAEAVERFADPLQTGLAGLRRELLDVISESPQPWFGSTLIAPMLDVGQDEALRLIDAGADLIQPVSKTFSSYDELAQLRRECDRPLSIQILGWLEGLQPAAISEIAGLATFSLVPLMTATAALMRNLKFLRESLSCQALPNERTSLDEFKEFIGFNDLIEEHRKYAC